MKLRVFAVAIPLVVTSGCAPQPIIMPMVLPGSESNAAPQSSQVGSTTCVSAFSSGTKKGDLNAKDVAEIVVEAGFPTSEVTTAVAVAMAESGFNATATNLNSNGSTDYGLFQINSIHSSILSEGNKFNPLDNAKMAFKIWKQAGGKWSPWVTYNTGMHRKYMNLAASLPDPSSCTPVVPVAMKAGCGRGTVDFSKFSNGQIPREYLCPLWTNPSHMLRPDAAQAFDNLSKAYVQQFKSKPCVTDSYRSYAAQVDVARRKPGLAARPGTSNHGLGQAVDLGCGIQEFGTIQFNWMKANAPKFGWKHPDWAEPSGSKPEPWHWEFGVKY